MDENRKDIWTRLKFLILALVLDFSPVPLFYLAELMARWGSNFAIPMVADLLLAVLAPIAGIVMGILSLSLKRKQMGKIGIGMSIAAILIPIIAVITITLLFTTGVLRLM